MAWHCAPGGQHTVEYPILAQVPAGPGMGGKPWAAAEETMAIAHIATANSSLEPMIAILVNDTEYIVTIFAESKY